METGEGATAVIQGRSEGQPERRGLTDRQGEGFRVGCALEVLGWVCNGHVVSGSGLSLLHIDGV